MEFKTTEITEKLLKIKLSAKRLSVGVVVLYLLASAFKLDPLFRTVITFPAVFIIPGLFLLLLTHRGKIPCLSQLIVESFVISTAFNVLFVIFLVLAGIPVSENVYAIFMVILLLIMFFTYFKARKHLAITPAKGDYLPVFATFLTYTFAIILLSRVPRYFTPDETEYIFNGRAVLNGEVLTMGAPIFGSEFTTLLSGRLFWTFLIPSFLAATGLQPENAYLIGPVFSTMTALAITLLVPKNLKEKGIFRPVILLLILTNPLLVMFSGIGTLNDIAIAFYVTTAIVFFAKSFTKKGDKVSLETTSLLKTLVLLGIATLIKPYLPIIVFFGMWIWLAYVILRYKLYRLSMTYKLIAVFSIVIPLLYEVLIEIPYVIAVWLLKNQAIINFYQQITFVSPVDLFLSLFIKYPNRTNAVTLFTQDPLNYFETLYSMLTPEVMGITISALALVLPIAMFSKPFKENVQLRATLFITQISMIFSYIWMIGTGLTPWDVPRYFLPLLPSLMLITTIWLYNLFSNLSKRALFLLHIPMVILLGINYVLLMTRGGVMLGWGSPRFTWTYIPLTLVILSYAILVTILTTQSLNPIVKLCRRKAMAKRFSVNARVKAFYILTIIIIFSNICFSYSLISYSIGFTDHRLKYIATVVSEYAENKVIVASNYAYLRLYLGDETLFKGLVVPPPISESEFFDLLKIVPNGTLLLISNDMFISYGLVNQYIFNFSKMDIIVPQNSSMDNSSPAYALKIYHENLPYGELNLYRIINNITINNEKGNITVNEARILVQDDEIILNLNVSSLEPTKIFTFIRADDGRFVKTCNTSLQTGNNDVKYSFDVNSPYRYSVSLSQPRVFIIDGEGHIIYNQVVYKFNIKLIVIGVAATVAMMLALYILLKDDKKRCKREK